MRSPATLKMESACRDDYYPTFANDRLPSEAVRAPRIPDDLRVTSPDGEATAVLSFSLERYACLTSAELAVARSAAAGMSNGAIAMRRRTSVRTIANQLGSVFRKIGAPSRATLATIPELSITSSAGIEVSSLQLLLADRPGGELSADLAALIWREVSEGRRRVLAIADVRGGSRVLLSLHEVGDPVDWTLLTSTETSVIRQLTDGAASKQVAAEHDMSPSTVSCIVRKARMKLGFVCNAQLLRAFRSSLATSAPQVARR
jgi:DNA-binding NarL/FixJ family response regulator